MPLLGTLTEMLAIYYPFFFQALFFSRWFLQLFAVVLSLGKTGHFYFGWGKEVDIESIPPYWTGWWTTSSLPPEQTSKAWKNEGFFFGRTKNIPQTNEAELRDSFIGAWRLKVNSLASNFNHCSSFLVALLDSSATIPPGCPDQPYIGPFPPIQHKWNPKLHLTETPSTHQVQHPCRLYTG